MFTPCTDKRVAVFFADGCEEIEGLSVVDVLYRAGIPCDKVSISDSLSVTSSHQVTFLTDKLLSQVLFDDYSMLVLPGGLPGTTNLEACEQLMQVMCLRKMVVHLLQSVLLLQFTLSVDCFRVRRLRLIQASSIFFQRMALIFHKMRFVLTALLLLVRVQEQLLSLALRLSVIL